MTRALVAVAVAAALLAVPAAGARHAADPGVTATQIVIGGTGPLTGPESAYKPVLTGAQAYFSYVNDHGGVYGRKIVYKVEDDQYNPAQTVTQTQKLVESDHVFAIFNSIGTEQSIAIASYLNQRKVPELFVGSGAVAIGERITRRPRGRSGCCRASRARAPSTDASSHSRIRTRRSASSTRTTSTGRSC